MKKHFVIVQSKKDHDNEFYQRLIIFWWIISSALFTFLFVPIFDSLKQLTLIFFGFILLFSYADLTRNRKTKAYAQVLLGIFYGIWGVLFLVITYKFEKTGDDKTIGIVLAIIFFIISYNKIKKYTRLFDILFRIKRNHKNKIKKSSNFHKHNKKQNKKVKTNSKNKGKHHKFHKKSKKFKKH